MGLVKTATDYNGIVATFFWLLITYQERRQVSTFDCNFVGTVVYTYINLPKSNSLYALLLQIVCTLYMR